MVVFSSASFNRDLNNAIKYSLGFLEGVQRGKRLFLQNVGSLTIELMKEFVDSNARVNPAALHHVYEWYQTGSPNARLFNIDYAVSNLGLSFKSSLRQSQSVKSGSYTPFYDKARIMEEGIPVTIRPKNSKVLAFTDEDGNQIFTQKEVRVENPGGEETQGSLERTLDLFMTNYFTQAFMYNIGIDKYFSDTSIFKKNFKAGVRQGKSKGVETGYRWITNVSRGEL
jgi:hypothetical protein